jgi:nucleotide-binding universal stress UspA family protein
VFPADGDPAARETAQALADKLGATIAEGDADLIVVGSQAGGPEGRVALSGAARTQLNASRGSVLVVPGGKPVRF